MWPCRQHQTDAPQTMLADLYERGHVRNVCVLRMLLQMPPVVESCLAQMASSRQLLLSNAPAMLQLDKPLLEGLAKVGHEQHCRGRPAS
jgi:hypothetical protein